MSYNGSEVAFELLFKLAKLLLVSIRVIGLVCDRLAAYVINLLVTAVLAPLFIKLL